MGTFIKTFFVCLILCLGFIGYKCYNHDSYSPVVNVKNGNSPFSTQKENTNENNPTEKETPNQPSTTAQTEPKPDTQVQQEKSYSYNCYFYGPNGELSPLKRKVNTPLKLETAIVLLLKGPLVTETKKGYYSEIPAGVNLISVKSNDKRITVDLTSRFEDGDGSQSIENRLRQLKKTIKAIEPNKSIYLHINGKEVEYLGGDGVYVKQPL